MARPQPLKRADRLADRVEAAGEALAVALIDDPRLRPLVRLRVSRIARGMLADVERVEAPKDDTQNEEGK